MGEVYRARHALLRRPTAVKILRPELAGERNFQRFEREVQLTSRLDHPNAIQVYDYGITPEGLFYYAMELLEGADLECLVRLTGPFPVARTVHVLRQAAGALAQAHATFFTVLHFRAAHADLGIEEMIAQLHPQLGKTLTPESLRQTLHRARALFADLLIAEIGQSLTEPTQEQIEEELGDLNLLSYCRPALERKRKRSPRRA